MTMALQICPRLVRTSDSSVDGAQRLIATIDRGAHETEFYQPMAIKKCVADDGESIEFPLL